MSGICGVVLLGRNRNLTPAHLAPMLHALGGETHDETSVINLGAVGLGAKTFPGRLAGVEKQWIQEHPIILAFHGNLDNLSELCPTKQEEHNVVAHMLWMYLQEGIQFLQRLRGDFALALWDGRVETLHIAVDRFRVHPLFYYHDQDQFSFASRVRGILACPLPVRVTIEPEAIVDVVASSVIPTPKTIFREVKKLPPGYVLSYHAGKIALSQYWDINFLQLDKGPKEDLVNKLNVHMTEAVSVRFNQETAPDQIGTFLSGGVDSSTVTGILTQLAKRPIKSFSIGFSEQRFNELHYARIAAQAFNAENYEYFVTPQDTYGALPILVNAFDEPFANASAIPTYFCARMSHEQDVKTLYAGDGGDELFAGNERYSFQHLFSYYDKVPRWLQQSLVEPFIFTFADKLRWSFFERGKKYILRAAIPYPERICSYSIFNFLTMSELFSDSFLEQVDNGYDPDDIVKEYYSHAPAHTDLDRHLYLDLKLSISDNDLFKVVRMTEAAGVSVQFPFLDHRLAEFAASIPTHIKMRGTRLRSFFKDAFANLLPPEIRHKEKHGFGLPIPIWLRTDRQLNEMMRDLLLSPKSMQRGYFRKAALEDLVERHQTDATSFYGTILWNLCILELWLRHYADSLP